MQFEELKVKNAIRSSMLKKNGLCCIIGSWIRNEWSEPGFTGLNDLQD
jgi:hypothetical protein